MGLRYSVFKNKRSAFNELLASASITLFCRYGFKDLTPTDTTDNRDFATNYKNKYLPTYFENVSFADSNIVQPQNATLGNWTAVIDTTKRVTKVYRIIEDVIYNLEYLSELEYNSKTYEEQLTKYYTLSKGLKFADRLIQPLEAEVSEELILGNPNVFNMNNSNQYDVDQISVDRVTISITGDIQ